VAAHLCLSLIIKESRISVEHDRVATTLNIIFSVVDHKDVSIATELAPYFSPLTMPTMSPMSSLEEVHLRVVGLY
jgi:hypothetical protein